MSEDVYEGVDNLEVMTQAVNYNRYILNLAKKYIPRGNPSDTVVMDFGAGVGTFCRPISELGYDVLCVEPDTDMRNILINNGINCKPDIHVVDDESVDYIYTFNVLEHIEDDEAIVKELFRVLKPGGTILVYVPAFQMLYSAMDKKVGHYRRYRLNGLKRILVNAGFEVVRSEYVDSMGFFASILYKWVGSDDGKINLGAVVMFDRVAFPLSRLFDFLVRKIFGKNALVIATK